jgi:hypothetical protein
MKLRGGKAKEEVTSEHQGRAGRALHTTNATGPRYRRSDRDRSVGRSNVIEVGSQGNCENVQEEARQKRTSLPSPNFGERMTRSSGIRCTNYGPNRRVMFPRHFFCSKCDYWEANWNQMRSNASSESARNKCQAGHTDPTFPTTLMSTWCPSLSPLQYTSAIETTYDIMEDNLIMSDNEDMSTDSSYVCSSSSSDLSNYNSGADEEELEALKRENKRLLSKNKKLLLDLANSHQSLRRAKQGDYDPATISLSEHIKLSLDKAISSHPHGRRTKIIGQAIAAVALRYREGIAYTPIMDHLKNFLRTKVFSPMQVARLMDLNGGSLNLVGLSLLRSLETNASQNRRNTILPSTYQMRKAFGLVEQVGQILVPYELTHLPDGEAIKFNYSLMIKLIFKSFGLEEAALEREVGLSLSIDGATLTKFLGHVMAGFKIKDKAAVDPFTNQPLFLVNSGRWDKLQSRQTCFPLHLHMGNENKVKYKEFEDMFKFAQSCSTPTSAVGIDGWKPFHLSINTDMSGTWKALGRGGGARTNTRPCYCCAIQRDEQHKPNTHWCHQCLLTYNNQQHPEWKCYHRRMVTDHVLQNMEVEMNTLINAMKYQLNQVKESKVSVENPECILGNETALNDPLSVWYRLDNRTNGERASYSDLLDSELIMRGVTDPVGNLAQRQHLLKQLLVVEFPLRNLSGDIEASKRPEHALFLLMQAIPCVLHLENRVSLKTITMLIIDGVSSAVEGILFADVVSEIERVDKYIATIELIVNTKILGSETSPSQWRLPYDKREKKVGTITLENWRSRNLVGQLELLVQVSVPCVIRKGKWYRLLPKYRSFMQTARQNRDWNTPQELAGFQHDVDLWFHEWVSLHGKAAITNYVHMLASGHVAEYVFHWGNLYEHSQQGWEAFNALVKSFFFRRTNHGGGRDKTRLKAIARWLQRRAIHMCGYDEISIRQFIQDRLDDEELQDCENSENSADDDDEVDETMELNEQVDVMDLYHMMGTVTL